MTILGRELTRPTTAKQDINLNEQIQKMVRAGAALGETEQGLIFPIGIAIVDEGALLLLSMNQWAQGTGDAHLFRWDQAQQLTNQVVFKAGGEVVFGIAAFGEWPQLDHDAIQESFAAWKRELQQNRKDYERFCRQEFRILSR